MLIFPVFGTFLELMAMDTVLSAYPGRRNLTYHDIIDLMRKNEIIIVDVRQPEEIKQGGSIPGSINIPLKEIKVALSVMDSAEFRRRYGTRVPNKMAPLVFFCQSGVRSKRAMEVALSLGFENSCNYSGGYDDWLRHNRVS